MGTVLLEASITFDVPIQERTTKNLQALGQYSTATTLWKHRQDLIRTDVYRRLVTSQREAENRGDPEPAGGWPSSSSIWTRVLSGELLKERDREPQPERPNLTRSAIDPHVLKTIQEVFTASPVESLNALSGTGHSTGGKLPAKYLVPGSVQCFSSCGLADITAAQAFSSLRALCRQKRASVDLDAPDASLWEELVRQPTRVLRIVWSFASHKKLPVSAYSLAELQEEVGAKKTTSAGNAVGGSPNSAEEERPFFAFARALCEDSKKSSVVKAAKKRRHDWKVRNLELHLIHYQKQKTKCRDRGRNFIPKKPRSKIAREALIQVLKESYHMEKRTCKSRGLPFRCKKPQCKIEREALAQVLKEEVPLTRGKTGVDDEPDSDDDDSSSDDEDFEGDSDLYSDDEDDEDDDDLDDYDSEYNDSDESDGGCGEYGGYGGGGLERRERYQDRQQERRFYEKQERNSKKELNTFDRSQLSFDFAAVPFTEDPRTGFVQATLTVRLAPGAFSVCRRKDKSLAKLKRQSPNCIDRNDIWQDRVPNSVFQLLGKAFPERWRVDKKTSAVSDKS